MSIFVKIFHGKILSEYSHSNLRSPFLARIFGVNAEQPPYAIVSEMSPFGDLRSFMLRRATNPKAMGFREAWPQKEEVLFYGAQISEAMCALHRMDIVHGNLALRNVLVFSGMRIKVADFGLPNIYNDMTAYQHYNEGEGPTRLNYYELAPESVFNNEFSKKSDVWMFGNVMLEILTGCGLPYYGRPNNVVYEMMLRERSPEDGLELSIFDW